MLVKIKRLHDASVIPQYAKPGDSGFDLVATEDVIVRPGETVRVPTGLAFELPPGYELQVRPRSGITSKTKLRVQFGTVDAGYRGEVAVMVDNIEQMTYSLDGEEIVYERDTLVVRNVSDEIEIVDEYQYEGTYLIRRGDRIAQGVITPVIHAEFSESDELSDTERGAGGFGSSGTTAEVGV